MREQNQIMESNGEQNLSVLLLQPKYVQNLNIIVGFHGVSMLILVLILEDGNFVY